MQKSKVFSLIIFLLNGLNCYSQINATEITERDSIINQDAMLKCLIASGGYNNGWVGELGFGMLSYRPTKYLIGKEPKFLPKNYISSKLYVASEFIGAQDRMMVAPKMCFTSGISFVSISYVNFLYYTDFTEGAFSYRPEIGFNIGHGHLYYGYNIPLSNKSFLDDFRHQIGFSWFFKVGKSKITTTYQNKDTQKKQYRCGFE